MWSTRLRETLVWKAGRNFRNWMVRITRRPPIGRLAFGDLRRVHPLSSNWGYDRGRPIDRHYIEGFMAQHAADVRARVLEVQENDYTLRYGGDRVTRSDVLDLSAENRRATIVADLTSAEHVAGGQFDCIICTQTLHLIYDLRAAVATLHRWLAPGGVLLATLPGVSQISRPDFDRGGDHWRVTTASASRLFAEHFGVENTAVRAYGNVLTAIALLEGIACEELTAAEMDYFDPDYQVTIAVRAVKAG